MKAHIFLFAVALIAICSVVTAATCPGSTCPGSQTIDPIEQTTTCPTPSHQVQATIFPFNPPGCVDMPRIPHTFGGCVLFAGIPAPARTVIEVRGTNVNPNTLILDGSGCFGLGSFDKKLVAQGTPTIGGMVNIPEGTNLYFFANGKPMAVCVGDTCRMSVQYHTGHHTTITLKDGEGCGEICD